jgi:hypothetical protein
VAQPPTPPAAPVYEGSDKHKHPWQRGRRGSLCAEDAQLGVTLLPTSVAVGRKRYAVHDGKAYCGEEHEQGRWHGWPVGWKEVPESLRRTWRADGSLRKRDEGRYWRDHEAQQ